ncbi:MAG: RNA polymerase sigma factor [Lachnospiraceae bacterium]
MEQLVKRAKKGDKEAFITLIEGQTETLKRVAYAWLNNEEDIADVIQDTILDAYEHIGQLKKAAYFRTWIVRILINNCTRIYRKNKKHAKFEISTDGHESGKEWLYGVIFQMYFGEQFTTAEIAGMLHMKENTVKSRIHRGKEKLRRQIDQ